MKHPCLSLVAILAAMIPATILAQSVFQVNVQEQYANNKERTGVAILIAVEPGKPATLLTTSELVGARGDAQYLVLDVQTGAQILAQVEANDREANLAVLRVPGLQGTAITVPLEGSRQGRQVQMQLPSDDSRVGHLHSVIERRGQTFYRFSVRAETGEAGAPLMNNCGELLSLSRDPDGRGWRRSDRSFGMGRELAVLKEFLSEQGVDAKIAANACPSVEEQLAASKAEREALEAQKAELEAQKTQLEAQKTQLETEAEQTAEEVGRLAEIESQKIELETQLEQQQEELSQRQKELDDKTRMQTEWETKWQQREDEFLLYGGGAIGALLVFGGLIAWLLVRARKRRLEASNRQLAAAREELARSNATFPDLVLSGHGSDCGPVRIKINGSEVAKFADGKVLGRSSTNADYFVNSQSVSRRHARLFVQNDRLLIEDLDSLNGTRVDGLETVPDKPVQIREGSTLELGSVVLSANFPEDSAHEAP